MRKKALHEKREKAKNKKGDVDNPGVIIGIEAYTHSDTPLIEFRGPYYETEAKRRKEREALRPRRPRDAPPGAPSS